MESKEILKEFAGKLAGLLAAAKVVVIAGAVSAYSGTGYAAAKSAVKAENRITAAIPNGSEASSEKEKSKETSEEIEGVSEKDNGSVLAGDAEFSDSQFD